MKKTELQFIRIGILFLVVGLLLSNKIFSQIIPISEMIIDAKLILLYEYRPTYTIEKQKNGSKIVFENLFDESNPNSSFLPVYDLFVAVPNNKIISVQSKILNKELIEAVPVVNPVVNIVGEEIVYNESDEILQKSDDHFISFKGYVRIGDNYCAHLKVRLFSNKDIQTTQMVTKFELIIPLKEQYSELSESINELERNIITNPTSAKLFKEKTNNIKDGTSSWINYGQEYLKFGISTDGIYRITYNDLKSFGVNINSIETSELKLYSHGSEIPIYINGESDGYLNENDYIEFVGQRNMGGRHRLLNKISEPYNEFLNMYSDTTIFWLTWGINKGSRVKTYKTESVIPSLDTLKYYRDVIHIERNNWFDYSMSDQVTREKPYWVGNKTWIEGGLGIGTTSKNFTTENLYSDDSVFVYCKIMDYASDITRAAHLLSISVNSQAIADTISLNKYETGILSEKYKSSVLKEGGNKLNVSSFKTSGSINTCATDWYEIEYPRYTVSKNDSLIFNSSHIKDFKKSNILLNGFTSDSVVVWRYDGIVKRFSPFKDKESLFIQDTISKTAKYFAFGEKRILKPTFFYKKQFFNLVTQNSDEYIIITHKKFLEKAKQYAHFINSEYKINTATIDVDDIYDFYNYGYFSPEPIRDYLKNKYYSSSLIQLKYVFLIGAATYDYHHNKTKYLNLPSTYNYVPSFGAPVSDTWFVCWDSTKAIIPQINIGRLPVNTIAELELYFNRHKEYLSKPYSSWNKNYIFFSGGSTTTAGQIDQLKSVNQQIIENYVKGIPLGGNYHHFYKTINPVSNFGPYSINEYRSVIDSGAVAISYIGHSGTRTWDNSINEVSQLINKVNRSPFITDFGCSTAKFAEPDVVSFSQLFVLGEGGQAIGYIGNSSLGFISSTVTFPQVFYKQLFTNDHISNGEAHRKAKLEFLNKYGSDGPSGLFALTNTLIGDPIISLPIPIRPNLSITLSDLKYYPVNPTEIDKSLRLKVLYSNYGKVIPDSIIIKVDGKFEEAVYFTKEFKVKIPALEDSIEIEIPINGKSGVHYFNVKLDNDNIVDELNEGDNQISFEISIASSTLKDNLISKYDSELSDDIILLNPSVRPLSTKIITEYSKDQFFNNVERFETDLGEFVTNISLRNLKKGERYWFRSKMKSDNSFNLAKSFHHGDYKALLIYDENSFESSKMTETKYEGGLTLDTTLIKYELISAGHLDGSTAFISRNGENLIPESTIRGHHICVIEDVSYKLLDYKVFDVHGGGSNAVDAYSKFLDTLSAKYIVMFAVANSGEISNNNLKDKIKLFGSKFIDNLQFIGSWVMIGRKFANSNKVIEKYSNSGAGSVKIDTSFCIPKYKGTYETQKFGPAKAWHSIEMNDSISLGSSIKYSLLGIKNNPIIDTIKLDNRIKDSFDIKMLAKPYSFISIMAALNSKENLHSPSISSIRIKYQSLSELGTNYQVVSLSKDSLEQGEKASLNFSVYNVGESTASNFKIRVNLVKKDNSKEKLFEQLVDSILTEKKKDFSLAYTTDKLTGSNQFQINIDTENAITELYKDNNFYSVPFYVMPNNKPASLKLTIDGNDIINGDFISPKPNFKIELNDESLIPITDTTKILLYLNNKRIYFSNNSGVLNYNYSSSNPKMIVNYTPTLADGDYTLKVIGKNATDQIIDSTGIVRKFTVKNELQLLNAYNYPNPFKDDTYFTFKLTQIPDELKIIIYTIAGRKIKEIKLNSTELKYDFNRIFWDGRDQDGDLTANGVYLYKIISQKGSEKTELTQKLAILR